MSSWAKLCKLGTEIRLMSAIPLYSAPTSHPLHCLLGPESSCTALHCAPSSALSASHIPASRTIRLAVSKSCLQSENKTLPVILFQTFVRDTNAQASTLPLTFIRANTHYANMEHPSSNLQITIFVYKPWSHRITTSTLADNHHLG